jgi:hypothetical protein
MNRKFIPFKKRSWLHRHNPFQSLLKAHAKRLFGKGLLGASPITHFNVEVCSDQGQNETCYEFQTCQIQQSVDSFTYDTNALLAAVCNYLNIPPRSISKCNISLWDDVAWGSTTSS